MRKYLALLIFSFVSVTIFSQNIDTDIFGDLQYSSIRGDYKATLEKNIFDDLIFSDNKGNKITLENKYIQLKYPELLKNKERRLDFFIDVIYTHKEDRNYKATYSIDVFDKIIFKDNRNRKTEQGKDVFGNPFYEEQTSGKRVSIEKDLWGNWKYKSDNEFATLEKDIFDTWKYEDSKGNELEFKNKTWQNLKQQHRTEMNVFQYLINQFLMNCFDKTMN